MAGFTIGFLLCIFAIVIGMVIGWKLWGPQR